MTAEPLDIDVSFVSGPWLESMPDVEGRCQRAAAMAFELAGPKGLGAAEVSIVLSDDGQVRQLNRDYRGKDKSTNVLSFSSVDWADLQAPQSVDFGPVLLGDVIIAHGVAVTEAKSEAKSLSDHVDHLVVHGMLHLFGHDHEEDEEAERMEGLERIILGHLGIRDPYAEQESGCDGHENEAPTP